MTKKIGLAAVLYCMASGTRAVWSATQTNGVYTGAAPAGLAKVSGVKDVSIDVDKQDVDASDRDSNGWASSVGALRQGAINVKMNRDASDPSQQAMLQCFLSSGTYIAVAALSGDKATAGSEGIWFDAEVMSFKVSQAMNGMQEVDVVLKPSALSAVPPQWVTVSSS